MQGRRRRGPRRRRPSSWSCSWVIPGAEDQGPTPTRAPGNPWHGGAMRPRRLILGLALFGLCLGVPTAADAAVYCVGGPPGCSGTATTLSGAITSATGAGSPEDDTIVLGTGTFPAADLQVNTNPNGSLLIVGQGS